jgi:hypothetical protein
MSRRVALLTTLLVLALNLSFAIPAAAQQGSAFGPLPQAAPTVTAAPTATTTSSSSDSSRGTLFLIGGILVVGFAVMGWFIARDARRGVAESQLAAVGRPRDEGPHAHKRQAKAKARAKGRAQRHARKRNR